MKAVRIDEFGGTEVLKLVEVERPVPAPDEILLKVLASGVNLVDCVIRAGTNDNFKSFLKLPLILGCDAAGIIEEVGSEVTNLKIGDHVYGCPNFPGDGSYAEYCAAKAEKFALKPKSISFTEAAGVPLAALVAWEGLFELGKLQAGQHILIHGASGGVGSFALQLAKAKGAYVIGTTSDSNLEFLKQIGADKVINYKTQNFEEIVKDIDLVFDASPLRDNIERLKGISVLKEGGIFVSVNVDFPFDDAVNAALALKNAKGEMVAGQKHQNLPEIAKLIDEGKVKVTISKVYPLEQVALAQEESVTGHVRGKLVLEIQKLTKKA
ncbi:MAG: NADP-dependent oxidoreductase [Pedobacter sp.]